MSDQSGGRQPTQDPKSADALLAQILADFGAGNVALGGGGGDPYGIFTGGLDPTAQVGVDRVTGRMQAGNRRVNRRGPTDVGKEIRQRIPLPDKLTTQAAGEVLKKFYQLDNTTRRRFQALLYAGGFYGNVDVDTIAWGQPDEASFSAWAQAVARTARLNASGKDLTYNDVIMEAASSAGLDISKLMQAIESGDNATLEDILSAAGGGENLVIALSDPAGLRSSLDRAASAILGRRANAAEQRMFVSLMHGQQQEAQTRQQRGVRASDLAAAGQLDSASVAGFGDQVAPAGDQITTYTPPDVEGQAEELLRAQAPEEAGAHDIANVFAMFLDQLKAPVNVPRITAG